MGRTDIETGFQPERLRAFSQRLLADLRALRYMLERGHFVDDVRRIGAEQEMFLVDRDWRPAPLSMEILSTAREPHLTTELGRFNLELNLDPLEFRGDCLSHFERQLNGLLESVRSAAAEHGARVVLTGILPTLQKSDLGLENMTPLARYAALNDAMDRLRGDGDYSLRIRGRDELIITHDNVMLESCNTSFQVHLQVSPDEFANQYNIAQAIAAPVLSCATNSPLLFGRQLWRETRIALFEQSVDTRRPTAHLRRQAGRVRFGRDWLRESVLEIFEEDVARFSCLLAIDDHNDPLAALAAGEIPRLSALQLHNGTIYRWNRPCYGITDGKPHLRIENRMLPAGPTVVDELANATLWLGLMVGLPEEITDIRRVMEFSNARENFTAAARLGLGARLTWPGVGNMDSSRLLEEILLPVARRGLERVAIDADDIDRYLTVIAERVASQKTGSQWLVDSNLAMQHVKSETVRSAALVASTVYHQESGEPVHTWEPAQFEEASRSRRHVHRVEQIMSTDLFTLGEEDVVDLAASVMKWRHLRRLPVEDPRGHLVGLVTYRTILRMVGSQDDSAARAHVAVRDIMTKHLVVVHPETPTIEATRKMREHRVGCLPVVDHEGHLVGILTEHDLIEIAWPLLRDYLESDPV